MAKQPAKGRKTSKNTAKTTKTANAKPESTPATTTVIDAIPAEVYPPQTEIPAEVTSVPSVDKAPIAETVPTEEPKPAPAQDAKRRGGMLPLVLGGVIAGVIGFAVGNLTSPPGNDSLTQDMAAQSASITALQDQITTLQNARATDDVAALSDRLDAITAQVAALATRVTDLADQPAVTLDPSDPNTAAMASEMDTLRAQIAEMTDAAQTELAAARAAAAAIEENAAQAARNAAARAALARVQSAMESGAPLGAALNDLQDATGQPAPSALEAVREGVPTLASLQGGFADVARAALATARSEGVSGEATTGFGAFLRNQFDVRSTTPQEGDSADAVLSRAEDAMEAGRLSDALAEISALPEVARGAMSDWLALAEARADALAAVEMLSTTFSDN